MHALYTSLTGGCHLCTEKCHDHVTIYLSVCAKNIDALSLYALLLLRPS